MADQWVIQCHTLHIGIYFKYHMECKEWTHIVYIQCYLDWELYKAKIMHHLATGYSNAHKSSMKPSNLM